MVKVTIIGAGVMGSALAIPLTDNGHEVSLWGTEYDTKIIESIASTGMHPRLGINIPETVQLFRSHQLETAMEASEIVVQAISSKGVKHISRRLAPFLKRDMTIVTVTKGLERGSEGRILTIVEVIENEMPEDLKEGISIVAVGGPQVAAEVACRVPTAVVFSSKNIEAARLCQRAFTTSSYRVVTNTDIMGVELCAALKNVYAIGIAFCDGLKKKKGLPTMDNTKAALLTCAQEEMMKIVEGKGGRGETVLTLAGIGDLDVTCRKVGGRNMTFGRLLGLGLSPAEALEELRKRGGIVEGYETAQKAFELAKELEAKNKLRIDEDVPLLRQIYAVLYERKPSEEAIADFFKHRFL